MFTAIFAVALDVDDLSFASGELGVESCILPDRLDLFRGTERVITAQMHLGESEYLSRCCVISTNQSKDTFRNSLGKNVN